MNGIDARTMQAADVPNSRDAGRALRVVLSVIGKFHSFDLARQLHARRALTMIFSGYPRFKLRHERLPHELVRTFPFVHGPYMALPRREMLGRRLLHRLEWLDRVSLDAFVARQLPECDVFVGLSGSALASGRRAQQRGASFVCDRGSSHIRRQDELLREEHQRWGVPYDGIDPRIIEREEAEYAQADCITVPSSFAVRSFIERGVPSSKLRRLPYGVDLTRFGPTQVPADDRFDVLFCGGMSLRKGVPYLLEAYRQISHSRKSITFAGAVSPSLVQLLRGRGLWPEDARLLGHVPQAQLKDLMSRSHVMVLPSIEEGLALVQAQAMACGCVVIGSAHSGAEDLITDGVDGHVVPIRDSEVLRERMQHLIDRPEARRVMSARAVERVARAGGWHDYGRQAASIYQTL